MSSPAGIANKLDLHGTNCVVDAACASSLSALHLAAMELHTGKADVVVTGGCDTFNDIFMFMCFSKTPALSPTGDSKPFDADGDGTTLGEGLGVVVVKRLADAEAAGDTIYAELRGVGTASDGKGNAIYAPSRDGQVRCLRDAYATAGVDPATVELVEAHGTGTKVGDAVEAAALAEVFGATGRADRPWCSVGSVKSQIGHTKAAAGAAGLIKAVMALYTKVLPPTIKVKRPVGPLTAADTPFTVDRQDAAVAAVGRPPAAGRGVGVRVRREQLPRGPGRTLAGQSRPGLGRPGRNPRPVRPDPGGRAGGPRRVRGDGGVEAVRPRRRREPGRVRPGGGLPAGAGRPPRGRRPGPGC